MTKISKNTQYKRNCPNCNQLLYYDNVSSLNLAIRENKKCRSCSKKGTKTKKTHEEKIKKICEWSGDEFWVDWKNRNKRFKDKQSMYDWRKSQNHEAVNCLNCGTEFIRYKNAIHHSSGLPQQYCSNKCNISSAEKKEKLKIWGNSNKNHWKTDKSQYKAKETKKEKYGDANYNNMDVQSNTMMQRYGVKYAVYLPQCQSNGKTISKGQRKLYEMIKQETPTAELEYWLDTVQLSVDIFIPEQNKIIEYFGDYWHCNPNKYKTDYYHKHIHKTAEEIWKLDQLRIQHLERNGYTVEIVWEGDFKR